MYNDRVRSYVASPTRVGPPDGWNRVGTAGDPGDGPFVRIWLRLEGNVIVNAGFNSHSCPAAIACGAGIAEMVSGIVPSEADALEPSDLVEFLGGLPEGKHDRAGLAIQALKTALESPSNT